MTKLLTFGQELSPFEKLFKKMLNARHGSFQIKEEKLNHGKKFEPKKDRETYIDAMKLTLKWIYLCEKQEL